MKLLRKTLIAAILGSALITSSAFAGTSSTTFQVQGTVTQACSISVSNLVLPSVGLTDAKNGYVPVSSTTPVTVTCTAAAPINIEMSSASGSQMAGPVSTTPLSYGLYQDAAMTLPWGTLSATKAKSATTIVGANTYTLYGQIPVQSDVASGSYAVTETATVDF